MRVKPSHVPFFEADDATTGNVSVSAGPGQARTNPAPIPEDPRFDVFVFGQGTLGLGLTDGVKGLQSSDAILLWDALTPEQRTRFGAKIDREFSVIGIDSTLLSHGVNEPVEDAKVDAALARLTHWRDYAAAERLAVAHAAEPRLWAMVKDVEPSLGTAEALWHIAQSSGDQATMARVAHAICALEGGWTAQYASHDADLPLCVAPAPTDGFVRTMQSMAQTLGTDELRLAASRVTLSTRVQPADIQEARRWPSLREAADFAEARDLTRLPGQGFELTPALDGKSGYAPIVRGSAELEEKVVSYVRSLDRAQRQALANRLLLDSSSVLLNVSLFENDGERNWYEMGGVSNLQGLSDTPAPRSNFERPTLWPSADELIAIICARLHSDTRQFIRFVEHDAGEGRIHIYQLRMGFVL